VKKKGIHAIFIFAGCFVLIGTATYTGNTSLYIRLPQFHYGYSYTLAWISSALLLLSGVLAIIIARKRTEPVSEQWFRPRRKSL